MIQTLKISKQQIFSSTKLVQILLRKRSIRVWYTLQSDFFLDKGLWYMFIRKSSIANFYPSKIWNTAFEGSLDNFPEWALQAYQQETFDRKEKASKIELITKEYASQFGWKTNVLVGAEKTSIGLERVLPEAFK